MTCPAPSLDEFDFVTYSTSTSVRSIMQILWDSNRLRVAIFEYFVIVMLVPVMCTRTSYITTLNVSIFPSLGDNP